jgi:hypothetical protein
MLDYFHQRMSLVCQSAKGKIPYILATSFGSWLDMEITFPSPETSNKNHLPMSTTAVKIRSY